MSRRIKATDSRLVPERLLDLSGVGAVASFDRGVRNKRGPTRQPTSGKDCAYKAGWLKAGRAGRESEGSTVPVKACKTTRWREGSLLWSRLERGKREGMPETANNLFEKARQLGCQTMDVCQVALRTLKSGEGRHSRRDDPAKGLMLRGTLCHARRVRKIIVKPYAGKPHVRFERGFMETGQR